MNPYELFAIMAYGIGFLLMIYRNDAMLPSGRFVSALLWPIVVPLFVIAVGIVAVVDLARRGK